MSRQILIGISLILAVVIGALGWQLVQERRQPDGLQISVDDKGLSVKAH